MPWCLKIVDFGLLIRGGGGCQLCKFVEILDRADISENVPYVILIISKTFSPNSSIYSASPFIDVFFYLGKSNIYMYGVIGCFRIYLLYSAVSRPNLS